MKTLKRAATILALVVIASVFGINYWFSRIPRFKDPWTLDAQLLSYYRESYEANRAAFRESCRNIAARVPRTRAGALAVASRKETDLTIDTCGVPSGDRRRLLIVTSGVHGGEGYASSAVQRSIMDLLSARSQRPEMLFVHAVNPFGMKVFRRVTEENIDLNRNFDVDEKLFQVKNEGYREVRDLLNPETPANLSSFTHRFFALRAIANIALKGMGKLRQAVLQGQYEYPKGIYYGGGRYDLQKALLDPVLKEATRNRHLVVLVDLHTGYGARGTAHLFPNAPPNEAVRKLTESVFQDAPTVDWGDGADFYTTYGDFSSYVGKIMGSKSLYVPMVMEFGTLNSQTTKGSIDSIHITILENQSYQYGCTRPSDCKEIAHRYREMFFPSSPAWRSKIMRDSAQTFTRAVDRMMGL